MDTAQVFKDSILLNTPMFLSILLPFIFAGIILVVAATFIRSTTRRGFSIKRTSICLIIIGVSVLGLIYNVSVSANIGQAVITMLS